MRGACALGATALASVFVRSGGMARSGDGGEGRIPQHPSGALVKLLTANDVADLLSITPEALAQLRWRGAGPRFMKLGRSVRYHPADVSAYIDRLRNAPPGS